MPEFQTNFQIRSLPVRKVICGDAAQKMQEYLPDSCIDLIYLDPPFFSGRDYEEIWKDGSETRSFRDTQWYQKICKECRYPLKPEFLKGIHFQLSEEFLINLSNLLQIFLL